MLRLAEVEPLGDLLVRRFGGGRGERDARDVGPAFGELAEHEVVGPEVVSPLRHAVRLVDREECDGALAEETPGRFGAQALRGDVEEVEFAREVGLFDPGTLSRVLGRVEERGADADREERVDLVLHEGDERGDDDAGARSIFQTKQLLFGLSTDQTEPNSG